MKTKTIITTEKKSRNKNNKTQRRDKYPPNLLLLPASTALSTGVNKLRNAFIILHSDNQGKTQVVWDACDHIPETQ